MTPLSILHVGGPTALLELGGVRLLTDPTFDPPGDYPVGSDRVLTKTAGPAVQPAGLGSVDAVLLSHDQHPDNLDRRGRAYVESAALVLSTASAARRLGHPVRGLAAWEETFVPPAGGRPVRITAVPAQHGPDGSERLVGEVVGFVLSGPGLPTVYVSGDNASLDVVRELRSRLGPADVAVLFAGAAQTPLVPGGYLTLTSQDVVEAARILEARTVVPVHFEGWAHFTQGPETLVTAFEESGLAGLLRLPVAGEPTRI